MNNPYFAALLLIVSNIIVPAYADESSLIVEDAWIAQAPPVSKVMVAYMNLKNPGTERIEIVGAQSEIFSNIEFHETIHENGIASMVYHETLSIPANSNVQLKSGGLHLMLFNPKRPLKAGDQVTIKFNTGDGQTKTIPVNVLKP